MASITESESKLLSPEKETTAVPQRRLPDFVRTMLRNPTAIAGFLILALFIIIAIFAPFIAPPQDPANPYQIPRDGFLAQPQPPGTGQILGTTQGQYDLFYGIIWGTRTAFKIGLIVTGSTLLLGGLLGSLTAYLGGWVDEVFQRIVELFLAFPFLMAALTLATVLGPRFHNGLLTGMIALITFGWPGYARLIRGDVLSVKQRDFILASKALGAPGWWMLLRHIIPNAMYSLLVVGSLDVGTNVLTFAALSFLGVGTGEGYADWGQLLSFARNWIPTLSQYWYIVVYPGLALLLFVLSWNLIGDALRDALDPRLRGVR